MWKLYKLSESVISDRGPQFAADLLKKLNKMLGIETRLLIVILLGIVLKEKSLQGQLGDVQSAETLYNKLSDIDLLE